MSRNSKQSTQIGRDENGNQPHRFNPRDPQMEMLLRGLLHELRNPLSSILTAATLLHDSTQPDENDESRMLLDVVKKESLRLNHILTEFAGYIKLPPPQPHSFDITKTLRATTRQLQRDGVLPENINIIDEMPESCFVWADESQIRTALHHILRNASEAMPNGGKLRISNTSDETGESTVLCLTDSGKGFTQESKDRAFLPFYSDKAHSMGLGLSTTRSLIEAGDGRVWLEDNLDANPAQAQNSNGFAPTSPMRVCFELPLAKS